MNNNCASGTVEGEERRDYGREGEEKLMDDVKGGVKNKRRRKRVTEA